MPSKKRPRRNEEPASMGRRPRIGRQVRDTTNEQGLLALPLTRRDIEQAWKQRNGYDVDDPGNFSKCVLATCLRKIAGAEVQIGRKYAWVALPDEEFTRRYSLDAETAEIVKMNDRRDFKAIPANVTIRLLPPSPGRKLAYERVRDDSRKSHNSRGIVKNPSRPADPWVGVYRNAVHIRPEAR